MKKRIFAISCVLALALFFAACGASSPESNGEKAADTYIAAITSLYDTGAQYDKDGLTNAADYLYGTAAASACSMRYAVDCLLFKMGEGSALADVVGGRQADWGEIAALGYASPYPYVFEGIVNEAEGKVGEAERCYYSASLNPNLLEGSEYLKMIMLMDTTELNKTKEKLTALEDKIFAVYTPDYNPIPRNENNWNAAWLRAQGRDALTSSPDDYDAALAYYLAALRVDPYDGDNYAGCAVLYMCMEDSQTAIRYLNDGLFIDPLNSSLNTVLESMEGVSRE